MSRGNYKTKVIKRCRCRSPTHYHCTQKLKCYKENILWLKFCNECCCCCRRLRSERSQGASTSGQESSWKGAQEARRRGSFQVVTWHALTWHDMWCHVAGYPWEQEAPWLSQHHPHAGHRDRALPDDGDPPPRNHRPPHPRQQVLQIIILSLFVF